MSDLNEILRRGEAQYQAHRGLPPDLIDAFDLLRSYATSGKVPTDLAQASRAIMAAASIARARGDKPAVLPGTKDLQWPPADGGAFAQPMGYAPYLPRFQQIVGVMFPTKGAKGAKSAPAGGTAVAAGPEKAPKDPMAGFREMIAKAGDTMKPAPAPTEQPVTAVNAVEPDPDDPDAAP